MRRIGVDERIGLLVIVVSLGFGVLMAVVTNFSVGVFVVFNSVWALFNLIASIRNRRDRLRAADLIEQWERARMHRERPYSWAVKRDQPTTTTQQPRNEE